MLRKTCTQLREAVSTAVGKTVLVECCWSDLGTCVDIVASCLGLSWIKLAPFVKTGLQPQDSFEATNVERRAAPIIEGFALQTQDLALALH